MASCPFCDLPADRIFYRGRRVVGLWDAFPVSPGHALLVPLRHVPTWFDATTEEQSDLAQAIAIAKAAIAETHRPDGFNIGINIGEAAGQTVFHLHVHVIPRYRGDVSDPRGGIRHVVPGKGYYQAITNVLPAERVSRLGEHLGRALVRGLDDPFLPQLIHHLDRAQSVDIATAFVLEGGVRAIEEHLRDLLARGGRARLLTGDYLNATEPAALRRLLDIEGAFERRVFETSGTSTTPEVSFHPKAYIFRDAEGHGCAFVGSSNLTRAGLTGGVEWNLRLVSSDDTTGFSEVVEAFESLFGHQRTVELTDDWIAGYQARRSVLTPAPDREPIAPSPEPQAPVTPHDIQREALKALEATRSAGNTAGLVVLATGLGKTWLSAFDSDRPEFRRVLFVAHREEILEQARKTFRRIRPDATLGLYTGSEKAPSADVLFASIQTLGRARHLDRFAPAAFDYIVVDEFHHASATTYRRLIDYFQPKFLLGLTATPERTDGGDLLALCQENLVYRADLTAGIRRGLLCPFRYFGVPDGVDYSNIPWRSGRFDEEALTREVATQARAANALEHYRKRGGHRAMGFCVSQVHAEFMAEYFRSNGVRAVAVHSGATSAPRASSLEQLEAGALDIVFAVDMFNEGVDLPLLDTVIMLRPTESRILWLQQFGRGLRKAEGKPHLTVVDYIGNHRTFLQGTQTLLGIGVGERVKVRDSGHVSI